MPTTPWVNFHGNVKFIPSDVVRPLDEADIARAVGRARDEGLGIRVAGAGHSCTELVAGPGLLLDLAEMTGVLSTDVDQQRFRARAGTHIFDLGDPLWESGLALTNQGDIDVQTLAGAISTGTHGSGLLPSLSASVRALKLVDGRGETVEVTEAQPEVLAAAQVSLGALGVITEIEMEADPAYLIQEDVTRPSYAEVLENFYTLAESNRHFSYWWMPSDEAGRRFGIEPPTDGDTASTVFMKRYQTVDPAAASGKVLGGEHGARLDRSYRIYPTTYEPNFVEMEYMVPFDVGLDAISTIHKLIEAEFPDYDFGFEVRVIDRDTAFLSPNYETRSVAIACAADADEKDFSFMRAFHEALKPFSARPHWGKLHFFDADQLADVLPRFNDFKEIRARFDPDGIFLNPHLRSILG